MRKIVILQTMIVLLYLINTLVWGQLVYYYSIDSPSGFAINSHLAHGGNVTEINLTITPVWQGVYGTLINSSSNTNKIALYQNGAEVHNLDLVFSRCPGSELYATLFPVDSSPPVEFINSLESAPVTKITSYLGLTNTSSFSGETVFNETRLYNIGNNNITTNATLINSVMGEYSVGLLNYPQTNTMVFVANLENSRIGFNGAAYDYQILLPVPRGTNKTWYFFQDPIENCTPEVVLIDNQTTIIISGGGGGGGGGGPGLPPDEEEPEPEEVEMCVQPSPSIITEQYCDVQGGLSYYIPLSLAESGTYPQTGTSSDSIRLKKNNPNSDGYLFLNMPFNNLPDGIYDLQLSMQFQDLDLQGDSIWVGDSRATLAEEFTLLSENEDTLAHLDHTDAYDDNFNWNTNINENYVIGGNLNLKFKFDVHVALVQGNNIEFSNSQESVDNIRLCGVYDEIYEIEDPSQWNTVMVPIDQINDYLAQGALLGPCPDGTASEPETVTAQDYNEPISVEQPLIEFPLERKHQLIPAPVMCTTSILGILVLLGLWAFLGFEEKVRQGKLYGGLIALLAASIVGTLYGVQYCGDSTGKIVVVSTFLGIGVLISQLPLIRKGYKRWW